ncbi:MAG: MFS transporter [Zoogloeaceae bacterium]|jgi:predicted MFS family arabinose efflux permease|nr:MFS transporter [Zoogloeaceae bacterium]
MNKQVAENRADRSPAYIASPFAMLMMLTCALVLSQAFRTVATILALPLKAQFDLSAQALGLFSGTYHFTFGALQFFMGMSIDVYGVRRTVLSAFPFAIAGALLSALAPRLEWLVFGQMLIGIGCAPAFLVCTVFVARHFPPTRFAALSGLVLGLGSAGMIITGTPLAWLVEHYSWRAGFAALGIAAILVWLLIWWRVHEPARAAAGDTPSMRDALRSYGPLFKLPHTAGILLLGFVGYASFISLRGLWLGPMLNIRHGLSLVECGNVALVMSLINIVSPPLFGRLDPGTVPRRRWIVACSLTVATLFALMAFDPGAAMGAKAGAVIDATLCVAIGLFAGYSVLQYANVRSAYPAAITGRAIGLFNMSMFLGAAFMQWFTGLTASIAQAHGVEIFSVVFATIAILLALGSLSFAWLPKPPG